MSDMHGSAGLACFIRSVLSTQMRNVTDKNQRAPIIAVVPRPPWTRRIPGLIAVLDLIT
jgi:hypothetical protein